MMIWICIGLMLAGISAVIIEVFVPAGGILGFFGVIIEISGIVLAYINFGKVIGTIFLGFGVIGTPIIFALSFKYFPRNYFGKKLILNESETKEKGFVSSGQADFQDLVGKKGIAFTVLRPAGIMKIDDNKYNVVTSGEFIDKDLKVIVTKIEGLRIIVKKI